MSPSAFCGVKLVSEINLSLKPSVKLLDNSGGDNVALLRKFWILIVFTSDDIDAPVNE